MNGKHFLLLEWERGDPFIVGTSTNVKDKREAMMALASVGLAYAQTYEGNTEAFVRAVENLRKNVEERIDFYNHDERSEE